MNKLATSIYLKALVVALCFLITSCGGSERKYAKHIEKGKEYYASSEYKEAAIEFKNAIQIKPDDAEAHYNLGLSYLKVGGQAYLPAAFKSLVKATELDPGLLDAQVKIGELHFLSKDLAMAEEQAKLVLNKDKNNLDATILLANINAAKGKLAEAKNLLTGISAAHPESTRPLLALSTVYLAGGERDAAKDVLRKAIAKGGSVEPRISLAGVYMLERNITAAEEELTGTLKDNPKSVPVLLALTNFYIWTNRPDMAEQTAEKLIIASDEKAESYIMLANIHRATGNIEKARETLKRGIERSKDPVKLQKLLAADYLDSRQVAEASAVVAEILKKNEKDLEGLFLRGRVLLLERKPQEALSDLSAYVEANPKSPIAQYFFGLANMMTGNASVAKTAFNDAITLAPRFDEASFMLSVQYLEIGELRLANLEAQKLAARNPSYPGLPFLMGDISLRQGRHDEAVKYFEAYTRNNPQDAKGFAKLAAAQIKAGNAKKAVENAEKSLALAPDDEVLALAVSIDLSARNFDRALSRINGQISKTPDRAILHLLLGKVYAAAKDDARAEQSFKMAIEKDANFFPAYVDLGGLYARRGSFDDALKQYRESVRVNPKALPSYMLIGVLSEKKGDFQGAIESYKKALEVNPKFAPAANNLAWLYSEKGGNIDVALTLAETAKEQLPNEPAISDTLGWIYYKKHAYLKAITLLKESAAKMPNEPAVRYHLGMAYYKKGDKALARQELKRALDIKGNFEGADEARKTLASLK
jgi:tetratricopeptide (TPR) repeat protein